MESKENEPYLHIAGNRCVAWNLCHNEIEYFLRQVKDKHIHKNADSAINAFCKHKKYKNSRSNRILFCKNNFTEFREYIKHNKDEGRKTIL